MSLIINLFQQILAFIWTVFTRPYLQIEYKILWSFFFSLLLIVHTWNSSPLLSDLLWLKYICFTVPTTSGKPHGSPLVWACQWPSSQPLSSPQLSHNNTLWEEGISKSHRVQGLDYWEGVELDAHLGQISVTRMELWTDALSWWKCHWPDLKSAGLFRRNLFLNSLKTSTY